VAITAAIAEKSEFEKINLAPSSGEIGIERGPLSHVRVGSLSTTTPESLAILGRPIRPLVDSTCRNLKMGPYGKCTSDIGYIRASASDRSRWQAQDID